MPLAFPNLEGLVRLSHSEGIDIRRPLLRVLTDLYIQEKTHAREAEQQYIELTLRLLPAVDIPTRAAVARKLAVYAATPTPILEALAQDVSEVATLIRQAARTPGGATEDQQQTGPEAGGVPDAPSFVPDAPDASRPRNASESAGEFFLRTDPAQRAALLESAEGISEPTEPLDLPARSGAIARLEKAAMRRARHEFTRELQLSLGISGRVAWRISQDAAGEPLLVAAKALDMPIDILVRILLFHNPSVGESVERVFSLARLYEQLTLATIAPILASWRAEAATRHAPRFQPVHAPDTSDSIAAARDNARTSSEGVIGPGVRRLPIDRRIRGQDAT